MKTHSKMGLVVVAAMAAVASTGWAANTDASDWLGGAPNLGAGLTVNGAYGDNRGATTEEGDPLTACDASYTSTVWWRWKVPAAYQERGGLLVLDTKGSTRSTGEAMDTVLGVYSDDEYRFEYGFNDDGGDARDGTSEIDSIKLYGDEKLLIGVSGKTAADRGDVKLNLTFKPYVASLRFLSQGGTEVATVIRVPEGCKIDELGYENIAQPTRGGNRFDGWWTTQDESGIELTGEETYEELKKYEDADHNIFIYAHWVSNGASELKFDSSFRKTQKLSGIFLNGGALVGAATVTMTKKSSKNIAKAKIAVMHYETLKTFSSKATTMTFGSAGAASCDMDISIKDAEGNVISDTLHMVVQEDGAFTVQGKEFHMEVARIGGAFSKSELVFNVQGLDWSGQLTDAPGAYWISEAFPTNLKVSVTSNGVKLSTPKGTTLKYKTLRLIQNVGRPIVLYVLDGLSPSNENKAMLKLSYNYRDGRIKGTFMLYQTGVANYGPSTGHSRKPTLKKFVAIVKGLAIDERFWGMATIKRPTAAKFFAQME